MTDDPNTLLLALPPDIEIVLGVENGVIAARNGQRIPRTATYVGLRRIKAVLPVDEQTHKTTPPVWGPVIFFAGTAGVIYNLTGWWGVAVWGLTITIIKTIWNAALHAANLRKYKVDTPTPQQPVA